MKSSLLQVCDGEILKTLRTFGKQQRLTRRNVKQILRAADQRGQTVHNALITEIGLGGIPGMLASIQRVMTFDSYRTMKSEAEEDIRVIEGTWNATYQAHWKGMTQGRDVLPEYVPDRVKVYVDSGYILRRIEYLKKTGADNKLETMFSMEFDKIKLNTVLDEKDFTFVSPPKVHPEDVTRVYIDQLIQQQRAPAQKQ
jgi:hypothetical protein